MKNYKTLSMTLVAVLLVITTAAASVYFEKNPVHTERAAHTDRVVVTEQPVQNTVAKCNDENVAGKVIGGVGGGVLGSLAGKGGGKTATTIVGTLGGAYLGGQVIPLQNVTCR